MRRPAFITTATACLAALAKSGVAAPQADPDIPGFAKSQFSSSNGRWHWTVYRAGGGPPVLILHELYGLTPQCVALARRLADPKRGGFSVYIPLLFGTANHPDGGLQNALYDANCVQHVRTSGDFAGLDLKRSSPIVAGLAELVQKMARDHSGAPVGAIGQCLTGNFPLALMQFVPIGAAIMSQPALPFALDHTKAAAIGLSDEQVSIVKGQADKILAFRFQRDHICPTARFETYANIFGKGVFDGETLPSPTLLSHAVLTDNYDDSPGTPTRAAYERAVTFLSGRLRV
jgi:dienelactone hydrolase